MDLFEEYRIADAVKALQIAGNVVKSAPIFSLKKLEWEKKLSKASKDYKTRTIQEVAVSNNVVIIATNNCCVLRWNVMDTAKEPEKIEIPTKPDDVIEHVFIDLTGHHVIIALRSLDNYYLHSRSLKPKKLSKLLGLIECIAFDRQYGTESLTKSFLIGTSVGIIYEMSIDSTGKEKICQPVYQLDQQIAITSIYFDSLGYSGSGNSNTTMSALSSSSISSSSALTAGLGWGSLNTGSNSSSILGGNNNSGNNNSNNGSTNQGNGSGLDTNSSSNILGNNSNNRLFVMWSTSSPTRLYHFTGGPSFITLFSSYMQSGTTSFTELPGSIRRAQLHCYTKGTVTQSTAQYFALMTEIGVYHGTILFTNNNNNNNSSSSSSGVKQATSGSNNSNNSGSLIENVILEAQHLPYHHTSDASSSIVSPPIPIAISCTEHHFLILRNDSRLHVLSNLNGSLVQEETIVERSGGGPRNSSSSFQNNNSNNTMDGNGATNSVGSMALGLIKDPVKKNSMWLITANSIYQINANEEDRHVWRIYLQRALAAGDDSLFEKSLSYTKTPEQRLEVMRARASFSIQIGRLDLAAIYYAQSGLSFDEVALSLMNCTTTSTDITMNTSISNSNGGSSSGSDSNNNNSFYSIASPFYQTALSVATATAASANNGGDNNIIVSSSSSSSSEQAAAAVVTVGAELTPLRVFLFQVLRSLPSSAKMQRTMLCTWLCDILLHQISVANLAKTSSSASSAYNNNSRSVSAASSENSVANNNMMILDEKELIEQFKDFLRANRSVLDVPTTLSLIISRNQRALLLFYAQIVGDYHRVVGIFISQQQFMQAIEVLTDAPIEKVVWLIYKVTPVLITAEPDATVRMLLSKPQLSITGVLPALLRYCSALDRQWALLGPTADVRSSRDNIHGRMVAGNSDDEGDNNSNDIEVPLDRDYQGNYVHFAIRYLKKTLARHGLHYGNSNSNHIVDDDDDDDYLINHNNSSDDIYYAQQQQQPEPALFHTLVWMLAKYGNNYRGGYASSTHRTVGTVTAADDRKDYSELIALLEAMYEAKQLQIHNTDGGSSSSNNNIWLAALLDMTDYDYILRQCRLYHRSHAAVHALLLLDCPLEAVLECLQHVGGLQQAKTLVLQHQQQILQMHHSCNNNNNSNSSNSSHYHHNHGADLEVLRSLWLEIAKYVIEHDPDMKNSIALIKESDGVLTIDDLLPQLPNFTEIDLFQEEICQTLKNCGDNIQQLKEQMRELADSADSTVLELESMKNRAYSMTSQQQKCEHCRDILFGQQFYLFPCSHGFHRMCLLQQSAQHLSPAQYSAVQGIVELLRNLSNGSSNSHHHSQVRQSQDTGVGIGSSDQRTRAQFEALQTELDGYIAADCPLCGFVMIQSLGVSLLHCCEDDVAEAKSWEL